MTSPIISRASFNNDSGDNHVNDTLSCSAHRYGTNYSLASVHSIVFKMLANLAIALDSLDRETTVPAQKQVTPDFPQRPVVASAAE